MGIYYYCTNICMNEEIKRDVEEINENVEKILIKTGGYWTSFFRGLLTGFGSVIGAFIALLIIGWVLNVVGIIPAFSRQADTWRQSLQQTSTKAVQTK